MSRTLLITHLVWITGCAAPHPSPEAHALQSLIFTAVESRDTEVCVSVAAGEGERDPSRDVMRDLKRGGFRTVPVSTCRDDGPETVLVRLNWIRTRGDTLLVEGDRVAEHLIRYRCVIDHRNRTIQGDCAMVDHR